MKTNVKEVPKNRKIPKNSTIVRTSAVKDNKVVMVVKSPCRHYSALTFEIMDVKPYGNVMVLVDKKFRCGMRKCAKMMF